MKAWDDLVSDPEKTLYSTSRSMYWIENGVKIERFNNGKIQIRNCMVPGDDFEKLHKDELDKFSEFGWEVGMYNLCVKHQDKMFKQAKINLEEARSGREKSKRKIRHDDILKELTRMEYRYTFALKGLRKTNKT